MNHFWQSFESMRSIYPRSKHVMFVSMFQLKVCWFVFVLFTCSNGAPEVFGAVVVTPESQVSVPIIFVGTL